MHTIQLDKKYELRFDMRALRKAEGIIGHSVIKAAQDPTMDVIGGLIAAGVSHEITGEKLTVDKALDLVEKHSNYMAAVESVLNALADALGGKNEKPENLGKNA